MSLPRARLARHFVDTATCMMHGPTVHQAVEWQAFFVNHTDSGHPFLLGVKYGVGVGESGEDKHFILTIDS